jgi:hypothetical protein
MLAMPPTPVQVTLQPLSQTNHRQAHQANRAQSRVSLLLVWHHPASAPMGVRLRLKAKVGRLEDADQK